MSTKKHLLKFLLITLVAFIINLVIWYYISSEKALEFLRGYIIELSLSVDNLFLFLIEGSDLLFAIDSIPAIFPITTNPLIVYSSNILAILGLRNLYFLLEKLHSTFKYGVGIILIFTGIKLGISFKYHISVGISIFIITFVLAMSVLISIMISKRKIIN